MDNKPDTCTRLTRSRAIRYKSFPKEDLRKPNRKGLSSKCSLGIMVVPDKSPRRSELSNSSLSSPCSKNSHVCNSSPSLISFSSTSPTSTTSEDADKMKYPKHDVLERAGVASHTNNLNRKCLCWRPSNDCSTPEDTLPDYLSTHLSSADVFSYLDNDDTTNSNVVGEKNKNKTVSYSDDWSATTSESRDSETEYSQCLDSPPYLSGIKNSISLYEQGPYIQNKNKAIPSKVDLSISTSTAQIFHVSGLHNIIKGSQSLPSRLDKNSRRDKNDWRSLDLKPVRTEGKGILLDEIMNNLRESKKFISCVNESEMLTRRMKKSLCNLLNITPKLHKCFKRGLYLASLVHQNGKVLVTNEDHLPALEVRCEQSLTELSLKWDFNWLAKVLCDWSNVKTLKRTFERPRNISDSTEFRFRLLETIFHMQKIIGLECLGTLHYQVLTDPASGSNVFLLVANLSEEVKVNSFLRWSSVHKLRHKRSKRCHRSNMTSVTSRPSIVQQEGDIMDSIFNSIPELITFNTSCSTKLPKGLYLGYVKLTSFIDQLRIMVSRNLPNVFPHIKIRESQRVTRAEWESVTSADRPGVELSGHQEIFRRKLFEASRSLLASTGVPEENILSHRLYINEVFEFSPDVSFIILIPNNRSVCSSLGEEEKLRPGYITLPLHQFEIYHMSTYHHDLTKRYSHVSTLMEAEVSIFNHLMRQGVADQDDLKLREFIGQLNLQQKKLDETWKSMRWISEVISNARDGRNSCGLTLDRIKPSCTNSNSDNL